MIYVFKQTVQILIRGHYLTSHLYLPTCFFAVFFSKVFQEYNQSVKQFESRPGPIYCKGNQQTTLVGKGFINMFLEINLW